MERTVGLDPGPGTEVHVWRADLDGPDWPRQEELPEAERARAEEILRAEPARRWATARWSLRTVLGRYLDEDPAAIALAVAPGGKPFLEGPGPLRFSLSHSAGLALIAVAEEREVGIDVERVTPRRSADYLRAWTRREAIAKCFGEGLAASAPSDRAVEVCEIDAGGGWAAALAVSGKGMPAVRRFDLRA
jgi:4'-phosphopantetheinyl transferase